MTEQATLRDVSALADSRENEGGVGSFACGETLESFVCLESTPDKTFKAEALALVAKYLDLLRENGLRPDNALSLRFYLSDIRNQASRLRRICADCALGDRPAFIGQTPLRGGRLALEARLIRGAIAEPFSWDGLRGNRMKLNHCELLFGESAPSPGEGSREQARAMFGALGGAVKSRGLNPAMDLLRTWIYVRDIDTNYRGMVEARNEYFREIGLTPDTHFVASTGIEGLHESPEQFVAIQSLVMPGLKPEQIEYMSARTHMPPTHVYGVAFERGTRVRFGDRSHYYVSGTASIGPDGDIAHPGDIRRQTLRMVENIRALLENHEAGLEDLAQAVVYLRNGADAPAAERILQEWLPAGLPRLTVRGPVCRPGWLIEMEAIAVNDRGDERFRAFC